MKSSWIVYKHTSPSGKVYIGVTSKSNPNCRWSRGKGYRGSHGIYNAVLKYGWDNIRHEILFTGLSELEAKELEKILIKFYKSIGISYNITDGGDGKIGCRTSEETKHKISLANKGKTHKMPPELKDKLIKLHERPVVQLDLDNNIIRSFSSAKSAALYYGKGKSTASHITECCKGKRNKVLNYKWMYKNG